jgi:hypothetical protein
MSVPFVVKHGTKTFMVLDTVYHAKQAVFVATSPEGVIAFLDPTDCHFVCLQATPVEGSIRTKPPAGPKLARV